MSTATRVLFVDHAAGLAGAEVALLRLLGRVDRARFEPRVLLLAEGPLVARLTALRIQTRVLAASTRLTETGREQASNALGLLAGAVRTAAVVPRLAAAIRGSGAELVVANSLKAAVLTAVAAPLAGRPWVWHLHDRIASDYLPGVAVRGLRMLAARGPRILIANSHATRATVPDVPDERVALVYPGVEVGEAEPPPRSPAEHPSFALVGRIAPTKGQLEFLRAAALTARDEPTAVFAVVGDAMFNDADFAAGVRALPGELGIADRVEFTGWLADPSAVTRTATAVVHASPTPEPFGQVVVEAMLAGVPVIASDAGGVPEIVDPAGEAVTVAPGVRRAPLGLLVAPGDPAALAAAMSWVIAHPGEAALAAAAARESVRARFDIAISAGDAEAAWARALRR